MHRHRHPARRLGAGGCRAGARGRGIDRDRAGGYELPEPGYAGARYDAIRDYLASRYMRGLAREEIYTGIRNVLAPRFAEPLDGGRLRSRFERAWRGTRERLGEPMADPEADAAIMAAAAAAPAEPAATDWPTRPDDAVYHGALGEIVRAVAPHTEADPVGVLGTLLASVGTAMGNLRYIYQGSAQAPNLFVVLVGDSSTGRKGTAGSIAREVMNRAYPDWSQLIVAGLGSGEGLVGYLKANEKQGEPRALVMESEFGRLLTVMAREGSTLSPWSETLGTASRWAGSSPASSRSSTATTSASWPTSRRSSSEQSSAGPMPRTASATASSGSRCGARASSPSRRRPSSTSTPRSSARSAPRSPRPRPLVRCPGHQTRVTPGKTCTSS